VLYFAFHVLVNPFPIFLKRADYALRHMFRSSKSYEKRYPPSTQYSNWKKVFNHCDIFCNMLVAHVCRGQVQQELSDKVVNPQDNERFFGYTALGEKKMNSNQEDSYLFTPPVALICGAADGDPNNPSFHKPPWSIDLAKTELFDLYPWLYVQLRIVDDAFALHPSFKARKGLCLFQARACLLAMERRISQAVKMLASLPVDDQNNLISESPPIHQRWSTYYVCRLPFFQPANFMDVFASTKHKWTRLSCWMENHQHSRNTEFVMRLGIRLSQIARLYSCLTKPYARPEASSARDLCSWTPPLSIKTKLDTILQYLKTPPNLSSSDQSSFPHEDDIELVDVPVTPSSSLPSPPPSSDWFKLSFDPAENSKGFACKKPPRRK
jgi:hypothetical protein